MDYDTFKTTCFIHGIDIKIIEACREFINDHTVYLRKDRLRVGSHTLGYAELADIVTAEQSILELKDAILMSTVDFDSLGRSLEKRRLKQEQQNPNKSIKRHTLKAFYLLGGII